MTALLGLALVALTLRQAASAVSPVLGDIRVDIPIPNIGAGLDGGIVLALLLLTSATSSARPPRTSRCCSPASWA